MSRLIRLLLPYPPSTNRYWRLDRRSGHLHRSTEAEAYCELVATLARRRCLTVMAEPALLRADVFRPRRAGDLTNTIKVLEDALRGIVYLDDGQTTRIEWERWDDASFPRVQLQVEVHSERPAPPAWVFQDVEERATFERGLAQLEAIRQRRRTNEKRRSEARAVAAARPSYIPPAGRR